MSRGDFTGSFGRTAEVVSLVKFRWRMYPRVGKLIRASEMATESREELESEKN